MAKKLLAFLLTFALLLSTVTSAVMFTNAEDATTEIPVWSGEVATEFAGGSGTKADPYEISNGEELAYLLSIVMSETNTAGPLTTGKYYELTANIYLNDVSDENWKSNNPNTWYSTSTNANRFAGNLNGNGYTIFGIYSNTTDYYTGLFPVMVAYSNSVSIENLTISDSLIESNNADWSFAGALTGRLYNDNNKIAHIYNCKLTDSVSIATTGTNHYEGGFIGFADISSKSHYQFSGCAVLAQVSNGKALMGTAPSSTKILQSYAVSTYWYDNNTTNSDTVYLLKSKESIIGEEAAKNTMPNLDWLRIWACSKDGTPYPMDYNTNSRPGNVWTGFRGHEYASGSGTESDPYIIETPEQLAHILDDASTAGKYYKITRDIVINDTSSENWTESAKQWLNSTYTSSFAGTLDGGGYTISGLYYNGTGFASLVPKVTGTTVFKNIRIKNSVLTNTGSGNDHNVSAFVSVANGTLTFENCIIDDTVVLTSTASAAGFAGYGAGSVTAKNCGVAAVISASRRPGAFIADFWGGTQTISNCYAVGAKITGYRDFTGTNNYGTVTDNYGTNIVTAEQMKGADALKNMPLLTGFGTTDSYPVIYQQGTKGAVWSGSVAADYAKGSGRKEDPYIIETAEQLVKLVKDANTAGKYFAINADIKLNDTTAENWTDTAKQWFAYNSAGAVPGGAFKGTLSGEGNKISGLYYNGSDCYVGLFGIISGATIKGLTVTDSYLKTTATGEYSSLSAFTGIINDANTYYECAVTDTVTLIGYQVSGYGSRGSGGNVTIDSCTCFANMTGADNLVGAFCVDFWSGSRTVKNSIGIGKLSPKKTITSTNNYATEAGNSANVVTAEQMQGINALDNMPLLTGYFATEGYPVRYSDGVTGTTWSGAVAPKFASGDGSKASPFVIKTGEQLARMLTVASNDVYFKLGADIILSDENVSHNWLDSTKTATFAGELNGNGYIISGLNYNSTATGGVYAGLIPVANGAYISNVILENSIIDMLTKTSEATYVGGIVGYVTGQTNLYSCYVAETVELYNILDENSQAKLNSVGGLIGGGNSGFTIDGCAFFGTLDGFDYRYGAVFGDVWGGTDATRIVKYTMVDKYVPSSRWGFSGKNNASTVEPALLGETPTDVDASFTVAETIKGDAGYELAQKANWNGRYFGTENYPVLSTLAKRFGDVNGDRIRNSSDLVMIIKNLINATKLGYNDVNADGKINVLDLVNLKKKFLNASVKDGYDLVWSDEFDGTALDETKWNVSQTRMPDTKELAQSSNGSVRSVSNGNLQLTAIKNPWYNESSEKYFEQHKYMTTGSVTTEGKMSYQYGYLEIRAKVPYKEGCWPSFWLRSHNSTEKQANPDFEVEVDVLEVFGSKDKMSSNLHQQSYNGNSYNTSTSSINDMEVHTFENASNLSQEYHTYAFEWEPDRMAIYVDGELQCEWNINRVSLWSYGLKANTTGFDTTMNILFNNHLFTKSSSHVPSSDNTIENHEDNLPSEFDIDYVRLYQKNDGSSKLILGE